MTDDDLDAFRAAWVSLPSGQTGLRYIEALVADGALDEALIVCAEVWALGYPIGLTEAAWVHSELGDMRSAIASMTAAIDVLDGDERLAAVGTVGCWRWQHFAEVEAESQLREGMYHYGSAWADLGNLLRVTGRVDEGTRVLREGAEAEELMCMLPYANILSRCGDLAGAELVYRRAYELGDAHAAWNLSLDLLAEGRDDEASEWRWKAAAGGDEVAIASLADAEPRLPD
ncbi:hypothetical protein [Agromyces atrinae]|uniref:Tetratricopeptide (TPR) repeat protein n=1 Tax=Agromyces atrinae TaxID=592376 RepID=A0A4Q2M814_9MICO|nr:hypothetical protein [Agromyces atrinae]NYD67637.1 tetratricopeptide (TPR) repeat protein [Agromyces atrinae]RXZ88158.1 hypothetical protein ESP50_02960 [Agromyces atrinae]